MLNNFTGCDRARMLDSISSFSKEDGHGAMAALAVFSHGRKWLIFSTREMFIIFQRSSPATFFYLSLLLRIIYIGRVNV